jgi:hypothetical protein
LPSIRVNNIVPVLFYSMDFGRVQATANSKITIFIFKQCIFWIFFAREVTFLNFL